MTTAGVADLHPLTRRRFLAATLAGAAVPGVGLPWIATVPAGAASATTATAAAARSGGLPLPSGRLVVVFLRGGMDGLSAVVPAGEAAYHDARPTVHVPAEQVLPLDGRFGLHPAMGAMAELYRERSLAVVHAVGNATESRSHFEAQAHVELGGATGVQDGWLARLLGATRSPSDATIRAVAISALSPISLRGCTGCLATPSLAGFGLGGTSGLLAGHVDALGALYASAPAALGIGDAADAALAGLARLGSLRSSSSTGSAVGVDEAEEPGGTGPFAAALGDALTLLHADVGVEVVTIDTGGWDTHNAMGTASEGTMRSLLAGLSDGLAGFWAGVRRAGLADVTVVVLSEFGRRVAENGSGGLDHGSANAMFVLGEGLAGGGTVIADWPGLGPDALVRGDLRGTIDYRDVLAEVATGRFGVPDAATAFPGLAPTPVGVV